MRNYAKYVGVDDHKDSLTIAVAEHGRAAPSLYGEIRKDAAALRKLAEKLGGPDEVSFCYEAGPGGYVIYRWLRTMGYECVVVSPALVPKRPGERVKTDRRDALSLARQHRAGELTPVWVPGKDQEAVRDLVRCREDMKHEERRLRQRVNSFLLRHGKVYPKTSRWTGPHYTWIEEQKFEQPEQQIVLQAYVDGVKQASQRVKDMEEEMTRALDSWSLAPVVQGLMALRGVSLIVAMTVMSELGDLTRFDSPRQLFAFLGLVPSEYSTGSKRHQGAITKSGNSHVRRVLGEAAWGYRYPARKTYHLQRRARGTTREVQGIAWRAQTRLCYRYRYLIARGKPSAKVCTAIARELSGFIWAIACEIMGPDRKLAIA